MRLIHANEFIEYLGLDVENSREDNLGEIITLEDFDRQSKNQRTKMNSVMNSVKVIVRK